MKKMKAFFYVLRKTFTSPSYYRDILNSPIQFSLKFFFLFFFLYTIVTTAFVTVRFIIPMNKLIIRLPELVQTLYPPELEITIQNGQASTNVYEPYYIPLVKVERIFEQWQQNVLGAYTKKKDNILVIDTYGSLDDFQNYNTFILLTKTSLTIMKDNGTFQTIPLNNIKNLVVNQKKILTVLDQIKPYTNNALPILIGVTVLLLLIFFPLSKLSILFIYAFIMKGVFRIFSCTLTYKKSYQIGLHFIVISTILAVFTHSIPFFEVFAMIGLTMFVTYTTKTSSNV